jgi:hypothetical protein
MTIKACHWSRIVRRLERKIAERQPDGSLVVTSLAIVRDRRARAVPFRAWLSAGWRPMACPDMMQKGGRDEMRQARIEVLK